MRTEPLKPVHVYAKPIKSCRRCGSNLLEAALESETGNIETLCIACGELVFQRAPRPPKPECMILPNIRHLFDRDALELLSIRSMPSRELAVMLRRRGWPSTKRVGDSLTRLVNAGYVTRSDRSGTIVFGLGAVLHRTSSS